jgi:hypothetical protein
MTKEVVNAKRSSIRVACAISSINESCYRYESKLNAENDEIPDWLLRLQFVNNCAVLRSRNAFEEEDKRRKMYRLWLKMPNARALSPEFPGRSGFSGPATA